MSKVDILMATFQGASFIEEQIESILNQDFKDFTLLISDDGSSDDTLKIINGFKDPRIQLISKEKRLGVVGNFSHLLSYSKAPYILFCDQDDVWFKNKISKSLFLMQELEAKYSQSKPLLVHTDLEVVDQQLNLMFPSFFKFTHLKPNKYKTLPLLLTQNVVTGCTMMMNRALAKLSQPIPNDACMHDWWIALVAAAFGKIEVINEPLMAYRQHGKNSVGAKKYNLTSYFKRWLKKEFSKDKRAIQNELFLKRFHHQLSDESLKICEGFRKYAEGNFFTKRSAIVKYGFYKSGLYRNLYEWILS